MTVEHVNPKVLVIDDDSDARSNIGDILELDGYRADMAGTVREALGRANWDEYVAILVDRRLPDGTAEELIPRLKQRAPHSRKKPRAGLEQTIRKKPAQSSFACTALKNPPK
jgi:DNA-binding NtrC family response regulator